MRKLSVFMLMLIWLMLLPLSACRSEKGASTAPATGEPSALAQPTQSTALSETEEPSVSGGAVTTDEGKGGAVSTDEGSDLPDTPTETLPFADLMAKYPIVSELSGRFADRAPADLIGDGLEAVKAMESGVLQIDASISADMGLLGSSEDRINVAVTVNGNDYKSVVESTTLSDGALYTTVESDTYADGVYYYLYRFADGQNDFTEQYKAPLTAERFQAYLSGNLEIAEGADDADIGQITALVEHAFEFAAGMTEDGGCVYYAKGFSVEDLNKLAALADFEVNLGDYLSEDSMADIALAVLLDENGSLKTVYLNLPLKITFESEGLSISMDISAALEMNIRGLTEQDTIDPPADADDYLTLTEEELFG